MPMHCAPPPPFPSFSMMLLLCKWQSVFTFARWNYAQITMHKSIENTVFSSVQLGSVRPYSVQFSSFFKRISGLFCVRWLLIHLHCMHTVCRSDCQLNVCRYVCPSVSLSACLSRLSALITLHFERRLCLSGSFLFFFSFFVSCVFFFSLIFRHIARWVRRIEGQMK